MNIAHGLWSNSFAFRVERDALFQEPGERWTASWDRNGSTPAGSLLRACGCGCADRVSFDGRQLESRLWTSETSSMRETRDKVHLQT